MRPGNRYARPPNSPHRRLRDMARTADELRGKPDAKLQKAVQLVKELLDEGYRPILFCRFISQTDICSLVSRRYKSRWNSVRRPPV